MDHFESHAQSSADAGHERAHPRGSAPVRIGSCHQSVHVSVERPGALRPGGGAGCGLEKASWKRQRLSSSRQDERHVGHSGWQKGLSPRRGQEAAGWQVRDIKGGETSRAARGGQGRSPGSALLKHRGAIEGLCPGQPCSRGRSESSARRCRPLPGLPCLPALTAHAPCALPRAPQPAEGWVTWSSLADGLPRSLGGGPLRLTGIRGWLGGELPARWLRPLSRGCGETLTLPAGRGRGAGRTES